jgi:HPt (histidine-containing phosphotransfer) domain-containing protein
VTGDQDKFLGSQMDGYLTKPIRKSVLLHALDAIRGDVDALNPGEATRPNPNAPIIEMARFIEFARERSMDRLLKTLLIFVSELKQKADALARIIATRDRTALRALAHSAAGSGSIVGAARLVRLSRSIETCCNGEASIDWVAVGKLLVTIRQTITAFEAFRTREAIEILMQQNAIAA